MPTPRILLRLTLGALLLCATRGAGGEKPSDDDKPRDAWTALEAHHDAIHRMAREYMVYLDGSRTELQTTETTVAILEAAGFAPFRIGTPLVPGHGYYLVNRDRALLAFRPGTASLEDGVRVIAAHIDSPRLELKARPLYEQEGLALFQTLPHGGVKYYQWANVPLALIGRVDKTDGSQVSVQIGLQPDDPVFLIPDLAPHVDKPHRDRKASEALKGEELDPVAGSIDRGKGVRAQILEWLDRTLGIKKDDFVSAELDLVPALRPRTVGFDRGLIVAYGQDDRLCSWAALRALLDETSPRYWTAVYLADNEESGSNNNTGARSEFLRATIGSWIESRGGFDEMRLRRVLAASLVASADTTTGINPMDASVHEKTNAARINGGVVIKRYGRGNDANTETLARVRRLLEGNDIPWQTHTYKVDVGGGGTLGGFLSVLGMEVFDVGAPILSMHSPAELSSKADLYALYLFLRAFLSEAG